MKVKIIYRNYKPLHKIYESLVADPPKGVEYIVPKTNDKLKKFMPIYRKHRHNSVVKALIRFANKYVFSSKQGKVEVDLMHVVNMVPDHSRLKKPYILEAEHASALTGFNQDDDVINDVKKLIYNGKCKSVICTSAACKDSFKQMLGERYDQVASKFEVVYPTIKLQTGLKPDHEFIKQGDHLKLLFVGNDSYRKGLNELLQAVSELVEAGNNIQLYVVSNDAGELVEKYNLDCVKLYPANFSKEDIISKFFLPADVFILPTKLDTYGMVFIDSMASGTPVVATDQFAIPELVTHKKDGLLIKYNAAILNKKLFRSEEDREFINSPNLDKQLVAGIKDQISYLLNHPEEIKLMSKHAANNFKKGGKFDIEKRNKQILNIYKKALSSE